MTEKFIQLGDVVKVGAGQGAPQEQTAFSNAGNPFIRASSLESLCKSDDYFNTERINESVAKEYRLRLYPQNTVVFAKSGMSSTKNRIYRLSKPAYVVNHLATLEPSDTVNPIYLRYWLENFNPTQLIQDKAYPSISQERIEGVEIFLPTLQKQNQIAQMLDKADRLRRIRRYALEMSDSFLPAVFIEMFGDPVVNQKNWPIATLEEISEKITDGEHLNPIFADNGFPIVMAEQVNDWGVDLISCKHVSSEDFYKFVRKCNPEINDVLIVSRGATIGRTCVVDVAKPFCMMGSVILIKPNFKMIDPSFLASQLKNKSFLSVLRSTSGASAQQAIYMSHLKDKCVILPPRDLQKKFCEVVACYERLRATQVESLRQAEHLFQSLLHQAFSENFSNETITN